MIKHNMKSYKLYENKTGLDSYGQEEDTYKFLKNIEASLFTTAQKVISNDVRFIDKTITALVNSDIQVEEGYLIESVNSNKRYKVEVVVNANIYNQLYLEEVR